MSARVRFALLVSLLIVGMAGSVAMLVAAVALVVGS